MAKPSPSALLHGARMRWWPWGASWCAQHLPNAGWELGAVPGRLPAQHLFASPPDFKGKLKAKARPK